MKKNEFKKLLKQEKNPILSDRKVLFILFAFLSIILLMNGLLMIGKPNVIIVEPIIGFVVIGATLILEVPLIYVDIATDLKIKKMYKKHLAEEDYKNCCKRIKKPIIILGLILAILSSLILIDFIYCELTGNKPFISIKDNSETREYMQKYRGFFYDYYKCDDGRTYIKLPTSSLEDPYFVNVAGEDILLQRTEIIKDKVYIGIPTNFTKASKDHINTRYSATNIASTESGEVYQYKDGKINFVISKTTNYVENEQIEDTLDATIYAFDTYLGDYITWEDQIIQTIGENKKVGILGFSIDYKETEFGQYYCYMWMYSVDGQYIINSFDVDKEYMDEWKTLGPIMEDTLEFVDI